MIDPEKLYSIRDIETNKWLMLGYMGIYNLVREGRIKTIILNAKGSNAKSKRYGILGKEIIKFREGIK